jgi:hypothetical protein
MHKLLTDCKLHQWQERVDKDLAETARAQGCMHCGAPVHRGDYARKPRGGLGSVVKDWNRRESFCCSREGCRKRKTPPSVRFLGRKVYVGVVVVLMAAMMHGPSEARVARLREALGIDRRTLSHWRRWWTGTFVQSGFWKGERSRLPRALDEGRMPLSLVGVFGAGHREGLLKLLEFLSPITTHSCPEIPAM